MIHMQKFVAILAATTMLVTVSAFAEVNEPDNSSSSSSSSTSSSTSSSSSSSSEGPRSNRGVGKKARMRSKNLNRGVVSGKLDLACMQTAVGTRETSLVTALTTRKDELIAAWGNTEAPARNAAIKVAWKTFKDSRKNAWRTFKDTVKNTCKVMDLGEDAGQGDGE
ncbi:MAG TPA: hypothetical protein VJB82_02075 [Candidatus Peribacterales bacterium]|nr:hypothetical protein [Candidatus Peribacterales bacterium]